MKRLISGVTQSVVKAAAIAVCSVLFASVFTPRAFAADVYWTGDGGNNVWSTGANWSNGAGPGTGDIALFTNDVALAVAISNAPTIQRLRVIGTAGVTLNIASGMTLYVSNTGAEGLQAIGADLTVNGPGTIALSMNGTTGFNYLDNGATSGNTLTVNAKITDLNGGTTTGFETWIDAANYPAGTVTLGYALNDFTLDIYLGTGHTFLLPKIADAGLPSYIGAGSSVYIGYGSVLRYTGTGDSTDRTLRHQSGNAALGYNAVLEQSGTGPFTWAGPVLNNASAANTLMLAGDSASPAFITGNIYNSTGTLGVTKRGTGAWTLSGDNSFTGPIVVEGGALGLDSPSAAGATTGIALADGTALSINPSAADGFTAFLPPVAISGNGASVTVAASPSASTVTFGGVSGNLAITAPNAGTARNRIFIAGLPAGAVGSWLTLNGGAAWHDPANGLTPTTLSTQGIAVKGSTLPNGPTVEALINLPGSGGHIALPSPLTELYGLTMAFAGDDATVDTASKTLVANAVAINASAGALTVGAAAKDGALLPPIAVTSPPTSADIAALAPLIWYDPSDPSAVTVNAGRVEGLANKGAGGATFDAAVVRSGWEAPLYATGLDSHSALPMVKINANAPAQGLQSLANTGIMGNAPRTLVAVMSRNVDSGQMLVSFGAGSARAVFETFSYDAIRFRFGAYSDDIDMPYDNVPETPFVLCFLNGVGGNRNVVQGFTDGNPSVPRVLGGDLNTSNTPLHLGHRNGSHSATYRGQIGEVMLFNRILTDAERATAETYLLAKWKQVSRPPVAKAAITLRNDSTSALTVNAALTEPPNSFISLAKMGTGDVTLAGGTALSGPARIDAGTLFVDTPAGLTDTLMGALSGAGKLAKDGDGELTLSYAALNTYAGGTDVLGGKLRIGAPMGPGDITIADGATLDVGGNPTANAFSITNRVAVSGAGVNGAGAIVNTGAAFQYYAFNNTSVTLAGPTTFGGTIGWSFAGAGTLDLNGYPLTKVGTGDIRLSSFAGATTVADPPPGTAVNIQEGAFVLESNTVLSENDTSRSFAIGGGGILGVSALVAPVHWALSPADGAGIRSFGGNATNLNVLTAPAVLNGTLNLTASGVFSKTLSGQLSGAGGLSVYDGGGGTSGTGALSLLTHPGNTFTGPVAVSNAVLGLRYAGSLPNVANLSLSDIGSSVYVFAGGGGWTGAQVAQLANSGAFYSEPGNHRLGVVVDEGEAVGLPALTPAFGGTLDKYGTGTLAIDGDVRMISYFRAFAGEVVFTNDATFHLASISRWLILKDGNDWDTTSANRDVNALVGGNARITGDDCGYNTPGPGVSIGHNAGKGVLDLTGNAAVTNKLYVGYNNAGANGAVYQSGNSEWYNTGGANNDGRIGHNGYGYYQLDSGSLHMKGYTQLGSVNNATSVGILRQTGGTILFNGQRYTITNTAGLFQESYGGVFGISRGGKAVLHLEGGTFTHYGDLAIIESSGANAMGTMTVAGTAEAWIDRNIRMCVGNAGHASLNLNGGRLTAPAIRRMNVSGSTAAVNFNGGTLAVDPGKGAGSLFIRDGANAFPFDVNVYADGATIAVGEGTLRTVDEPLKRPLGAGIGSIIASGGTGYIAPPYVVISGGGGTGATALAHIDRNNGNGFVTHVEITSPGWGYTTSPTVSFLGGGGSGASVSIITLADAGEGGLTKTGAGGLLLNAPNTYRGPTRVEQGSLTLGCADAIHPESPIIIGDGTLNLGGHTITNVSVTLAGSGAIINGKVVTASAVKTGPGTATWDAQVEFAPVETGEVIPGLWEGHRKGAAGNYWLIDFPNPRQSVQLTTRAGNLPSGANNTAPRAEFWNGNYNMWIYTGYIWNRETTNITWSWRSRFDDDVSLKIDDVMILNRPLNVAVTSAYHTLSPGPHPIEIRFGDATGNVGDNNGGPGGISYDPLARGTTASENHQLLEDDGTGWLLTANLNVVEPEHDSIQVLEGTLLLPSEGIRPGLWEGHEKGSSSIWNTTTANNKLSVQLTTRAGNVVYGNNTTGDAERNFFWKDNYNMWIYTGYIWNNTGQNLTWTWRGKWDDNAYLKIDDTEILNCGYANPPPCVNYTLTPGRHPIEIRYGDNTGNVGDSDNRGGVTYDPLGRGETDPANYIVLMDPGDGSLLTADLPASNADKLDGITTTVADGAAVDTGSGPHNGLIISPAGDYHTGTNTVSGPLNGMTYRVTIRDPLAFAGIFNAPGLYEGLLANGIAPGLDFTSPNPMNRGITLTAAAGNCAVGGYNTAPRDEHWSAQYATYVYTGYIWNRDPTNVTWTWRFSFDDHVSLKIDGWHVHVPLVSGIQYADHTLTPGPHPIEIRVCNTGGNVGAVATLGGAVAALTYDPTGGGPGSDPSNFIFLEDLNDGRLLTLTANPEIDGSPICDVITSAGTLDLTGLTIVPSDLLSAAPPGAKYVIATAEGFIGMPVLDGFDPKWKTIKKGNELWLTTAGGTMILLR